MTDADLRVIDGREWYDVGNLPRLMWSSETAMTDLKAALDSTHGNMEYHLGDPNMEGVDNLPAGESRELREDFEARGMKSLLVCRDGLDLAEASRVGRSFMAYKFLHDELMDSRD